MNDYSTKTPTDDDELVEELVAQVADEFIRRMEKGEHPSIEEYAQRHPETAVIIRRTLGALRTMRTVDLWDVGLDDDPNSDTPQHTIGDFKLIRVVGRGGMGVVYEAEQLSLHRRVALKVLPYAAMLDERAIQRFRNEVTAAAQLDHPNIVPVHGVGCDRGVHHYAMRLVDGVTLAEIINQLSDLRDNEEPFPDSICSMSSAATLSSAASTAEDSGGPIGSTFTLENAKETHVDRHSRTRVGSPSWKNVRQPTTHFRSLATLVATVAEALDYAHHHGVIHRDVKPSNLMIDGTGKPWITDFGLAQVETGAALTMTGDLLGTTRYMSPEQLMAKRLILDHRTDVYSLGISLYELLTLELPFESNNRQELFRQIMMDEPCRPRKINPAVPEDLETIVLKAIEKNPADRYQTAQDFADDLRSFVELKPITARKSSPVIKTRRWIQRNSGFVSGALTVLTFSVVVMVGGLAFLISERGLKENALQAAQSEQRRASDNFDFAMGILQDFLVRFAEEDLAEVPGAERNRQKMLHQAAGRLDQMVSENPDRDNLQRAYADVLFKLGDASLEIDEALAENCYKRCIELGQEQLAGNPSPDTQQRINPQIAYACNGRAKALSGTRPKIAEQYFRESIDIMKSLASKPDQPVQPTNDLANLQFVFAQFLADQMRDDEAIQHFQQAIDVGDNATRGECFYQIARIHYQQKRLDAALGFVVQAMASNSRRGIAKRNYESLKSKILFEQNNIEGAKAASAGAVYMARTTQGEGMTKRFADWLIDQLQLDAKLAGEVGKRPRQLELLEQALALHLTYYFEMMDKKPLQTRLSIQSAMAEAQDALGQSVAAKARRELVAKLERMIELVPTKQPGITFPLGTAEDDNLSCVAIDDDGHVYVAGRLSPSTDLQPGYGFRDVARESVALICKYTADGTVEWTCPLGGRAVALAIDQEKNVFVKGMVTRDDSESILIGDVDARIPPGKGSICYMAKSDANGRILWIRWLPCGESKGMYFDHSLAVDGQGSVVVGGTYLSDFKLSDEIPVILRKRTNDPDLIQGYVAKFSADGMPVWARSIDAEKSHVGGVAVDLDENIYVCGYADPIKDAFFGFQPNGKPFNLGDSAKTSNRYGLLAKLNPKGETLWVRTQESEGFVVAYDVAVGIDDRIYYSCKLKKDTDLDASQEYNDQRDQIKDAIDWESNLSCWNPEGQLEWNLPLKAHGYISAYSLAPNRSGGVYVTGRITGNEIIFGGQVMSRHPNQGRDGFIASVATDGILNNVNYYTTYINFSSSAVPWAVAANNRGQIAVVGRSRGTVRAPTGEILRNPYRARWDGFVSIISTEEK